MKRMIKGWWKRKRKEIIDLSVEPGAPWGERNWCWFNSFLSFHSWKTEQSESPFVWRQRKCFFISPEGVGVNVFTPRVTLCEVYISLREAVLLMFTSSKLWGNHFRQRIAPFNDFCPNVFPLCPHSTITSSQEPTAPPVVYTLYN